MNPVRNAPQVLHSPTPATKDLSPGTPVVQDDKILIIKKINKKAGIFSGTNCRIQVYLPKLYSLTPYP
jgi:hypothetical protein